MLIRPIVLRRSLLALCRADPLRIPHGRCCKQKGLFILFQGAATPATVMFISVYTEENWEEDSKRNAGNRIAFVCLFSCQQRKISTIFCLHIRHRRQAGGGSKQYIPHYI